MSKRVDQMWRDSMGLSEGIGDVGHKMQADQALAHVLGQEPVEAFRQVHEDVMAVVQCVADPTLDLSKAEWLRAMNALWRAMNRMEIAIEFLSRAHGAADALYGDATSDVASTR